MENDRPSLHLILQVLEKVKHENIVKLLAIEEEQEGRGKVTQNNFYQLYLIYIAGPDVQQLLKLPQQSTFIQLRLN